MRTERQNDKQGGGACKEQCVLTRCFVNVTLLLHGQNRANTHSLLGRAAFAGVAKVIFREWSWSFIQTGSQNRALAPRLTLSVLHGAFAEASFLRSLVTGATETSKPPPVAGRSIPNNSCLWTLRSLADRP